MPAKPMIVAGIMSGTSADGIDVALCRISPARASRSRSAEGPSAPFIAQPHRAVSGKDTAGTATELALPRIKLLGLVSRPYPRAVRDTLLRTMEGASLSAADLSRLHWRLGELYAEAVAGAAAELNRKPDLIGLHGQTIHHETVPNRFLGSSIRSTWQTGEPAVLAERLRCPVVSDFRPADLAAGGQGAPLVPMLDWVLFRSARVNRVLQNLGGIANITAIPASASADTLLAFDTGPANMVIDACMTRLFSKPYDRNGATARRGTPVRAVLDRLLRDPYFAAAPPKSCGREQFGAAFTDRLIATCRAANASDADIVATATALTAESILDAYRRFVWPHLGQLAPLARTEFLVAGGGARNTTLMAMLRSGLEPLGVTVRTTEDLGLPAQAKEAVAFALLAWLTWHRLPGNIPSATGAAHPAILGKVSLA